MKDIQKIKEFFSKPLNEGNKSLYTDWDQFEKPSKIKVYLNSGKTLEISPLKLKGGKRVYDAILQAFIDDRFDITNKVIQGMSNNLSEAKKETAIDMAKKQLDALGVKYELSGNEFRPFKAIYKPTNKPDRWYDEFDDIIHLFNLGSAVKQSMNEVNLKASKLSSAEYQKAKKLKDFKASDWKWNADEDLYTKVIKEGELNEKIDFDKVLDLRAEKVEIEDKIKQVRMEMEDEGDESKANYYGRILNKLDDRLAKVKKQLDNYDMNEGKLTEANIPSNIRDFAKRKGVLPLVNKVAKWAEAVGARVAGGTAIGKNYSTLVLDLDYKQQGEVRIDTDNETITLFDEPVRSYNEFQRVYSDGQGNNLEEALVKKVISAIREAKSTPCWKGYEQKGMKEKNGKQVPNCVPKK
jgi:hypothetical protein